MIILNDFGKIRLHCKTPDFTLNELGKPPCHQTVSPTFDYHDNRTLVTFITFDYHDIRILLTFIKVSLNIKQ